MISNASRIALIWIIPNLDQISKLISEARAVPWSVYGTAATVADLVTPAIASGYMGPFWATHKSLASFHILSIFPGVEEGAGAAQGGKPVPRLLAKTVKREERQASRKEKRQPQKGRIPISKELLESEDLDAVAQHCNMRKTSAKACSVSLRQPGLLLQRGAGLQ